MSDATAHTACDSTVSENATEGWVRDEKLACIHYCLLLFIYSIYGYQVCPFLEQLNPVELVVPTIAVLLAQFVVMQSLKSWSESSHLNQRIRSLFWGDVAIFTIGGLVLATYNLIVFEFPTDSGGKVMIAFAAIGFYASLDLAFERERRLSGVLEVEQGPGSHF